MSKIYRKGTASTSSVKEMQTALKKGGYYKGKVDGVWGNGFSSAISNFKKATGGSNSYGNSFGAETIKKLFTNTSPFGSTPKTRSSRAPSSSLSSNAPTYLGNGLTAWGNYVRDPSTGNRLTLDTYLNNLRSGQDAFGANNIQADPRIQEQWNAALNSAQDIYNTNAGQLGSVYNQGVSQANQAASDAARQQYIAYRQNKNKLAEQLSSGGITGGASETALNSILNAYSSGLASNDAALQEALAKLGSQYQGNLSDLMSQLQARQSSIDDRYGQMQAEDLANRRQQLANGHISALESYLNQAQQNKLNDWNSRVSAKIQSKNPNYIYADTDGRLHYTNSKSAAAAAKAMGYTVTDNRKNKKSNKSNRTYSTTSKKSSGTDYSSVWGSTPNKSNSSSILSGIYKQAQSFAGKTKKR
nr:MAG TPA: Adenosylhomocysteinase [Caudoviricetes sp.]